MQLIDPLQFIIPDTELFFNTSSGKDADIKAFYDFLCHVLSCLISVNWILSSDSKTKTLR